MDVGVADGDAVTALGEGVGEEDGDGGFADAAFAGGDGDGFFYVGDRWFVLVG